MKSKKCSNCNGNQTITINIVKQTELEKLRDRDRYNREREEAEERAQKEWENSIEGRAYRERQWIEDMCSWFGW